MKQRFEQLSHDLAWKAVEACFDRKWTRHEILEFIEKYSGVQRKEIYAGILNEDFNARLEATEGCALYLEELVDEILHDEIPFEVEPVAVRCRADGMTGKMRNIACLCIQHQLLGHLVKLGIEPLLKARLLPTQHASIPKRGQTYLKAQSGNYFRRASLEISCFQKTDVHHAYESTKYDSVIKILKKEIPKAKWIIKVMEYLRDIAPDGHLIIGGYLDAWLFNFVMSYAIRYTLEQCETRRKKKIRYAVRIETYMDDFAIMGRTKSGVKKAVACLTKYLKSEFNMDLKMTTGIITLNSVENERKRMKSKRPAKRGNPSLDMGGYQIHRTYTTMRPRVHKRVARTFNRAYREIQTTGTIRRQRAKTLSARYGFVKQTKSDYFREKYHVDEVMKTAKAVNRYWDRKEAKHKKEWLTNAVSENTVYDRAFSGDPRSYERYRKKRPPCEQHCESAG